MFRILCILVCLHDAEASMIFNDILLIIRINAFDFYISPTTLYQQSHSLFRFLFPVSHQRKIVSAVSQTPVRMLWISVLYFAKHRLRTYKRLGNKIQYQYRHIHTRSRNIIASESTIATLNEMGIPIAKASCRYLFESLVYRRIV